jgi:diacylglycerol kinase family enzyme
VRARLHHGAHLPHPGIKERRSAAVQVELERPLTVRLDGVATGTAKVISVRVQPDALTVVI